VQAYQTKDGAGVTSASWVEAATLMDYGSEALPAVDQVIFVPADNRAPVLVTWPQIQSAFAHLLEPMGLVPERYLVRAFPPYDQLAALGEVLVD
ncbi:MAG: hypothetical protein FWD11_05250, partial [Micrococcales bacterium]|nr:hypothetical protein [Micrococcales bacterium]